MLGSTDEGDTLDGDRRAGAARGSFWITLPGVLTGFARVLTAVGAILAIVLGTRGSSSTQGSSSPTMTVTSTSSPPATVTSIASAPAATTPRGSTTTVSTVAIPTVPVPAGFSACSAVIYVNSSASCPFASNIYSAYTAAGGSGAPIDLGQIASPVTGRTYDVRCGGFGTHNWVRCTNDNTANQAAVAFPQP